jgi:hypothetical protein
MPTESSDSERLETIGKRQMVEATAAGEGRRRDPGDRRIEVAVEHMSGTIANVTVRSAVYVEYLQLVHTRDGWRIVNALWRYTLGERHPDGAGDRQDGAVAVQQRRPRRPLAAVRRAVGPCHQVVRRAGAGSRQHPRGHAAEHHHGVAHDGNAAGAVQRRHTTAGATSPSRSATEASGVHGAAHRSPPGTGPGKIRSPSPAARSGPQVKQLGKGWPRNSG